MTASRVRLRALQGTPLSDERVRSTVIAAAESLAERTGVKLLDLRADDTSITAVLDADRIAAIGFAAELRRSTSAWYAARHAGQELWGHADEQE